MSFQKSAIGLLVALLSFGSAHAEIMVSKPAVKLGIGERPSVFHAEIMNHSRDAAKLVAADSPSFERIELHTHQIDAKGMMRMRQVSSYALPAMGTLSLAPGGDHLMLFGYRGDKKAPVMLTLHFADGSSHTLSAPTHARSKSSGHHGAHHSNH